MRGQKAALARGGVSVFLGLLAGARVAQHHVAEHDAAALRVGLEILARRAVVIVEHRKAQNIGHRVLVAELSVQAADLLCVYHARVDLRVERDVLALEHVLRALFDQLAHAVRVLDLGLERDADEVLRFKPHKRFLDDLHVYFSSLRRTKRCGFASGLSFGFLLSYSAYALTMRCTSS